MKRAIIVCVALYVMVFDTMLFAGCAAGKAENITFTAVIEQVTENDILVTTTDKVGFDRASASFDRSCKVSFEFAKGQTVQLMILPQVRESYPVQVTAVKIELKSAPQQKQESMAATQTGYSNDCVF